MSLVSLPNCSSHKAAGMLSLDFSINASVLVFTNFDWVLCMGCCPINHLTHWLCDPNSPRRALSSEGEEKALWGGYQKEMGANKW